MKHETENISRFTRTVWNYYRLHGRRMPWRTTRDPYRILVSEIMLQQTQVSRVLKKYPEFIKAFPNFSSLRRAPLSRVLYVWQGMGYNRRALALKRIADEIEGKFSGRLPRDPEILKTLSGIGPATAGAIAAFAWDHPSVFIETNIRRVFINSFFRNRGNVRDEEILALVEKTLSAKRAREWYWALMDYGAFLGAQGKNPNTRSARYRVQPRFQGSNRELRGIVIRSLLKKRALTFPGVSQDQLRAALGGLMADGLIRKSGSYYVLAA